MKYLNFENYYIRGDSEVQIPKENEDESFYVHEIESFVDKKVMLSCRAFSLLITVLMIVLYFRWKNKRKEKLK